MVKLIIGILVFTGVLGVWIGMINADAKLNELEERERREKELKEKNK